MKESMGQTLVDVLSTSRTPRSPFTILVVEADPSDAELMLQAIEHADLRTLGGEIDIQVRSSAEGALRLLGERPIDLVLTDFVLPGMDGLDLVNHVQKLDSNLPIIVVTRMNSVQTVVDAMRRGAYDYILKPVNPTDLGVRLHRAIRTSEILRFNSAFKRTAQHQARTGSLVGASPAFQEVLRLIHQAASGRSTVLITGETGTGKGLIARAIHEQSREREHPYQVIDCTSMPEGMVESELFGHVRGAFTGAVADKPGLIELAEGGTAFLDEIGELPPALQAKILHVLEENEVRRVGGTRTKRVETRFIAATNQDLEEKVQKGTFRKDLYYRLAVIVIDVPPLRKRQEDVAPIARHLCHEFGREMAKPRCSLDSSAIIELTSYEWPGNVRELRNVIERAVMLATENTITADDIKALIPVQKKTGTGDLLDTSVSYLKAKQKVVADFTSSYLRAQLSVHSGHITKAAEASGIQRHYFSQLMQRYLRQKD